MKAGAGNARHEVEHQVLNAGLGRTPVHKDAVTCGQGGGVRTGELVGPRDAQRTR